MSHEDWRPSPQDTNGFPLSRENRFAQALVWGVIAISVVVALGFYVSLALSL